MLRFNKILLPIDLEEPDLELVHQACGLAQHFRSEIFILHVIQPLTSLLGFSDALHGNLLNESVKRAETRIDASLLTEFDGLPVHRYVATGNPATQIVDTARDLHANLIVMGTHGFGNVERVLVGSITAKVLNRAECPVWTGAHLPTAKQKFSVQRILCAVDFAPHSRSTVLAAAEMASEFGAHLILSHVTPSTEIYGPGGFHDVPDFKNSVIGYSRKGIETLQAETGVRADVFIRSGEVAKTLRTAFKETHADLLIIGRCGNASRLGSSGYAIIREAGIPVLSV